MAVSLWSDTSAPKAASRIAASNRASYTVSLNRLSRFPLPPRRERQTEDPSEIPGMARCRSRPRPDAVPSPYRSWLSVRVAPDIRIPAPIFRSAFNGSTRTTGSTPVISISPPGCRCRRQVCPRTDSVSRRHMIRRKELFHPVHRDSPGALPGYLCSHRTQEAAEFHDLRLPGTV